MNIKLGERGLMTRFGEYREILYYDGQRESIALVMGDVNGAEDVLCRIHSHCIGAHVFNSVECTCREEMAAAQAAIDRAGRGVIIWLDQEGKGNGHLALIQSIPFKKAGQSQADAYVKAGYNADARDYGSARDILADLGVISIALMTGSEQKARQLASQGIPVSATIPFKLTD